MANRKLYKTVSVNSEDNLASYDFDLEYYILEKEIQLDGICVNTYGVEICKCRKDADEVVHKEYRKVFDVFCTKKEAEEILEKLARNTVTPISLLDVLENLIGTGDLINEETSFVAV
ncbi:MAG: hypothetical protein II978_07520 [Clostridia bacterium]|nr:hypothetical protein [Clostridia bacterium]